MGASAPVPAGIGLKNIKGYRHNLRDKAAFVPWAVPFLYFIKNHETIDSILEEHWTERNKEDSSVCR